MRLVDSAKAIMSGEHSRRRGYLSRIITTWNQIILTAIVGIWAFILDFGILLNTAPNFELFCTQLAWASCLTAILLGLWRIHIHSVDYSIVRLYPILYLFECALIPKELHTIALPKSKLPEIKNKIENISYENIESEDGISYIKVLCKDFGYRGHLFIDILCIAVIFITLSGTLIFSLSKNVIPNPNTDGINLIVFLLLINLLSSLLIVIASTRWRNRVINWPIPKKSS